MQMMQRVGARLGMLAETHWESIHLQDFEISASIRPFTRETSHVR